MNTFAFTTGFCLTVELVTLLLNFIIQMNIVYPSMHVAHKHCDKNIVITADGFQKGKREKKQHLF